jgi:hypothetical protein
MPSPARILGMDHPSLWSMTRHWPIEVATMNTHWIWPMRPQCYACSWTWPAMLLKGDLDLDWDGGIWNGADKSNMNMSFWQCFSNINFSILSFFSSHFMNKIWRLRAIDKTLTNSIIISAPHSFESMRAEVALLRRKVGWLGCGWMPIPTFGALWVKKAGICAYFYSSKILPPVIPLIFATKMTVAQYSPEGRSSKLGWIHPACFWPCFV